MDLNVDLTENFPETVWNTREHISSKVLDKYWEIIGLSILDFPFKSKVSRNLTYEFSNSIATKGVHQKSKFRTETRVKISVVRLQTLCKSYPSKPMKNLILWCKPLNICSVFVFLIKILCLFEVVNFFFCNWIFVTIVAGLVQLFIDNSAMPGRANWRLSLSVHNFW